MKIFKFALLVLALVCGVISFSSCGSEETPSPVDTKNKIVGTWEFTDGTVHDKFVFNSDGTGFSTYDEGNGGDDKWDNVKIFYTYDEDTGKLTIMYVEDGKIEDTEDFTLAWLNDNAFMNEHKEIYYRQ